MQIQLTDDQRTALATVLNNARSLLQREEGRADDHMLKSLRKGEEVLGDVQRRLSSVELTPKEAGVLAEVIQHSIRALHVQGKGAQGPDLAGLQAGEIVLRGLQQRVQFRRLELSNAEAAALGVVLSNTIQLLQREETQGKDESALKSVRKGREVLEDLGQRLTGLDLSEQEASVLQDVVRHSLLAVQAAGKSEERRSSEALLQGLEARLVGGRMDLSGPERVALAIVLENAQKLVRDEESSGSTGSKPQLQKVAEVLQELHGRLSGIAATEQEVSLLKDVVEQATKALEAQAKSAAGPAQENLRASAALLSGLRQKLQD